MIERTKMRRVLRNIHKLKYTDKNEFDHVMNTLDVIKEIVKPEDYDYFIDNCVYEKNYEELKAKYGNKSKPTFYKHINECLDLFVVLYNSYSTIKDL